MARQLSDLAHSKQWTAKRIREHKQAKAKADAMQVKIDKLVASYQMSLDDLRAVESDALRTRNAAECNFERQYGEEAYWDLIRSLER